MVLPLSREGAAAGTPKQITAGVWDIGTLDWIADGREILFEGSSGGGNPSLWRIPRAGGKPVRFNTPSVISGEPTVARQSGRMVYVSGMYETKIFKMPLGARGAGEPRPMVEAVGDHRDLGVSPDGSRIAFTSNRTGSKEIWIANADGSNQTQLTSFNGPSVGSPRWSPDGKRIVFDGYASGSSDLYLISVEGGNPLHLTSDKGNEIRPSWSHDGQWIYFGWDRGGRGMQLWKIRPSGGDPVQVTRTGGSDAFETPDGRWLYVVSPPKLSRMRPDGGEETPLRNDIFSNYWTIGGRNVYVLEPASGNLLRAPFDGTAFETVCRFDDTNRPTGGGTCIGLPRDETYVIYRRNTRTVTTLMLIEGFR
jgi:Tol biopolymer transport system component